MQNTAIFGIRQEDGVWVWTMDHKPALAAVSRERFLSEADAAVAAYEVARCYSPAVVDLRGAHVTPEYVRSRANAGRLS